MQNALTGIRFTSEQGIKSWLDLFLTAKPTQFGFSKHHYSLDSCQSLSYIHHIVSFLLSIEVHGKSAPVFAIVYNWVNAFKRGHASTKDEHRSGCLVEVTTPEMIGKIHDIVLSNQRIEMREIVEATGISQGTVFSILHEKLGAKKISARWLPRLLSKENKLNHVVDFKTILALFRRNSDEFLCRYITVDETWIHHYTPETKEQSKQWVFESE